MGLHDRRGGSCLRDRAGDRHDRDRGFAPARLASTKRPVAELSKQVLPFTWASFVIAVIAGSLLFITRATEYFVNPVFWIKMALIVIAGINMMIFEFITVRDVREWNLDPTPPRAARLAGGISIACWVLVLVFGRSIAFTLPTE